MKEFVDQSLDENKGDYFQSDILETQLFLEVPLVAIAKA